MARCTSSGGSPQYGPNSVGGGTTSSNSMVLFATRATRLATGSACSASSDSSNGTRIRLNISSLLIIIPAKHTTISCETHNHILCYHSSLVSHFFLKPASYPHKPFPKDEDELPDHYSSLQSTCRNRSRR